MAIFNEILVGRWNRALQKQFAIKGTPPVRQLGGEVMPVINITKPGAREFRFLHGETMWGVLNTIAAVAASSGFIFLRNPPNSGILIIVERIVWFPSAAGQSVQLIRNITTGFAAGSAGSTLDYRQGGNPAGVIGQSTAGAVAGGGTYGQFSRNGTDSLELINREEDFIVMNPGSAALANSNNVGLVLQQQNAALNVSFWWRERPLEESEAT